MKPPILRLPAAADVEDAYRLYENRRVGLGSEFLAAVQVALDRITANPHAAPVVHRDTRRMMLTRFP